MHIDIVPNRGSAPAVLLRESFREGAKVRKRTLANLSSLPMAQVTLIRQVLRGDSLCAPETLFDIVDTKLHGHVLAVHTAMKQLKIAELLGSVPSKERSVVMAMIAARILSPSSKLDTSRRLSDTTLLETFDAKVADEDTLYQAMDWLLDRQSKIENRLAARHLSEGGFALFDLSSSYLEGTKCPLAARGYSRDGKKGTLQINYGLLTDKRGCPIAVSVFEGNTADPKTLLPTAQKIRDDFKIDKLVLVGDRGMISQKQIDGLKALAGFEWITALRSDAIRKLLDGGQLQLGLFDERNLFELQHPDYADERFVACRNPELKKLRAHKRQSLLDATKALLEKIQAAVKIKHLSGKDLIGLKVGKVIDKYKVAKHFDLEITDDTFCFSINQSRIAEEAALDGIYVVRTSVKKEQLCSDDVVRSYKALSQVERAFRSMKNIDLKVRPIFHHTEPRVRAHVLLCMLAYYVQWHMQNTWCQLLFSDEEQALKSSRDPVAPAKRSASADAKAACKTLDDGSPVHSFRSLLAHLSTLVRNTCRTRTPNDEPATNIMLDTSPNATQARALALLKSIHL